LFEGRGIAPLPFVLFFDALFFGFAAVRFTARFFAGFLLFAFDFLLAFLAMSLLLNTAHARARAPKLISSS
jgi:hypothetical protein